jgi:hypothetical protein
VQPTGEVRGTSDCAANFKNIIGNNISNWDVVSMNTNQLISEK